jgi:peroxiredoxin
MSKLSTGLKAPDFALFNTEKKEIKLSDFQGKSVVVLFFPLAFTGVCTTELCNTRDNIAQYANVNAEVLAISVDSVFALGEFKKQQNLNFDLLSDFNKTTAEAYGCLYEDFVLGMKGVAKRSAFVIDKNGYIAYAEVLEDAGQLPNFEKIQQTLADIQ